MRLHSTRTSQGAQELARVWYQGWAHGYSHDLGRDCLPSLHCPGLGVSHRGFPGKVREGLSRDEARVCANPGGKTERSAVVRRHQ